jgi:hypothetical protein
MQLMPSAPQGGRPVPSYTLRPEVLEAMRQGRTQFGMFGQLAQRAVVITTADI